jgi:hypothetical protein
MMAVRLGSRFKELVTMPTIQERMDVRREAQRARAALGESVEALQGLFERVREFVTIGLAPFSEQETQALRRLAHGQSPDAIDEKAFAEEFVRRIEHEAGVESIWLAGEGEEVVVTTVTATFDDELNSRLEDAFQQTADEIGNPAFGELEVISVDEPHPHPGGQPIFGVAQSLTTTRV